MGKRLRTTPALAAVVVLLVSACAEQHHVAVAGRGRAAAQRAQPRERSRIGRAERVRRSAAAAGRAGGSRADGPDRLHRAGPGIDQGRRRQGRSPARPFRSRPSGSVARAPTSLPRVADFATATGIKIQIDSIGSSHETVLKTRIEGGKPPDLAMLAQPTPILAYAAEGKVIDVATIMDGKKLSDEHANTIGLVTQGSNIWGIPYKADVKSTIWYPIKAFEAKGYTVPKTWDELIALSDKIVADGTNPWCVSAGGPGDATGWQITDWVEEVVLKTKGAEYYNDWISHKVTFQDPGIKDAFDKYVGKIFFTPNYVFGGNTAIVATDQKTPMDPMFTDDLANPKCWMQKIPTWYGPDFFPDQRASGQPSKYVIGDGHRDLPVPDHRPGSELCRRLG